jgi:3D (Asp-Asp-Asp) domain-containing protein
MQKIFVAVLAAAMLQLATPAAPVSAASIEQRLGEFVAQNPNLLQQAIEVKQDLAQGNKDAALNKVVAAVVANNNSNLVSMLADGTLVETVGAQVRQGVEGKVRQQVEERVAPIIMPYQNQITAVAKLLNLQTPLNPSTVVESNALTGAPDNYKKVVDMTATAYAPGSADNGKWGDLTYMGGTVKKGVAAVDPRIIPMGTRLWIEGYGEAIAEDQGGAIKGNRIDLAFNTRPEALDYGIQNVKVYLLE